MTQKDLFYNLDTITEKCKENSAVIPFADAHSRITPMDFE